MTIPIWILDAEFYRCSREKLRDPDYKRKPSIETPTFMWGMIQSEAKLLMYTRNFVPCRITERLP